MTDSVTTVLIGKAIECVEYDYDRALRLYFSDGTMLYVSGRWHNDDTAGTAVALLQRDDPKTWEESRRFYDVVQDRSWPE